MEEKPKIKKDCFGFDSDKSKCTVLDELLCRRENCNFYKSLSQIIEERKKYGGPTN